MEDALNAWEGRRVQTRIRCWGCGNHDGVLRHRFCRDELESTATTVRTDRCDGGRGAIVAAAGDTPPRGDAMSIIVCRLSSDTLAAIGENSSVAVQSGNPVLSIARQLVAAGVPSSYPMRVFRGDTLALTIRNIGQAAKLEVDSGPRFVKRKKGKLN